MNEDTPPFYFINVRDNFRDNIAEHVFDMLLERHGSFENYPIVNTTFINNLIVNGFKYNQVDDHVVCSINEAEIKNWSEDECIEYAHVTLSPYCAYANKIAEHESFGDNITINAVLVKEGRPKCVYRCMSNLQSRMDTFVNFWPAALRDMIINIAEAGLFTRVAETKLYVSFAIVAYVIGILTKTPGSDTLLKTRNVILYCR